MQTLSPTISPTIAPMIAKKGNNAETDFLPEIAQSSVMQTALAGLDASLNDELDRYRHWQANGQTISYLNPFRPRAVSTQSIWTSPSLSEALSPIAPPTESNSDRRTIQMPVMPPLGTTTSPSINISSAELHNYRGLGDLENIVNTGNLGLDETSSYAQNLNGYASNGMDFESPTMAKIPVPDDDEILQNFANDYADHYADNYQQAGHQEEQVPSPIAEKNALRSLMNPVGIISLLLLLFSSAAIGYLLVDPSGVMKLFKPEQKPKAAQTDTTNEDLGSDINLQNQQKSNSSLSFVPFAGDKTQANQTMDSLTKNSKTLNSLVSKNTLNNSTKSSNLFAPSSTFVPSAPLRTVPSNSFPTSSFSALPPALAPLDNSYSAPVRRNIEAPSTPSYSQPTTRTSPSRSNSSARSTTSDAATARSNNPAPAPTAAYVAPSVPDYVAPRSNTAVKYAAPLSSAPTSTAPSSYRVVVENSYAASAQQIERDAYVRPSDGQVQVGSYRDQNAAQQRIEQLRRQGIPARIE